MTIDIISCQVHCGIRTRNCQLKHFGKCNLIQVIVHRSLANSSFDKLFQMNGSIQETKEDQHQTHGNNYCVNSYNVHHITFENSYNHKHIPVTRSFVFPFTSVLISITWILQFCHSVIRYFDRLSPHFQGIILHRSRLGGVLYTSYLSLW